MKTEITDTDLDRMEAIFFARGPSSTKALHFKEFMEILGIPPQQRQRDVFVIIGAVIGYHRAKRVISERELKIGDHVTRFGKPGVIHEIIALEDPRLRNGVMRIKYDGDPVPRYVTGPIHQIQKV